MYNRTPKKLPVDVTENEFTLLLQNTKSMKHKVGFLLAWGSGLRVSECVNVNVGDVDMDEKTIRVNQGKGSKDRIVPLPRGFKEKHIEYVDQLSRTNTRTLQKAFKRSAEHSGLLKNKPTVHFHSLRHGFATQCLRKGISLRAIQMMLGHNDLSTTAIYLQLKPEEALNEYQDKF